MPASTEADQAATLGPGGAERAEPDAGSGVRTFWRRLLTALLIVLGVIVLCWLVLFLTKGRFLKRPFEQVVGRLTHRAVRVPGDFQLYFAPFDLKLVADGLTIANPSWATRPNLFQAQRLEARIAPLSLLFGRRRLYALDMTDGAIDLEWNAANSTNSWTFDERKGGKRLVFPIIDTATVRGTAVRFRDPRLRLLADLRFETIASRDARIGRAVHFDGAGQVRATPFTVTGALLSPDATVARGRNRLELHARAARNLIDMHATLPSLAQIENVPLAVAARGRNLAELLDIIGVVVPDTRAYALTSQLVVSGADYRFTGLKGRFGDSDLAGRFTVHNVEPRVHVDADLATRRLDIVDVAPFIGYNPDLVAAQGVKGAISRVGGAPRLLPNAPLRIAALRNFDADVRYKVAIVRSRNVPLSNISLTLGLDNSLLTLSPLTFDMVRGRVASDVVIDARRRPAHTSYDIRLLPTPIGRLLAGFGVIEAGTTGTIHGRLLLQGDGDSVHDSLSTANGRIAFVLPSGTFWMRNVQLAELDLGVYVQRLIQDKLKEPVRINCGLIGFTVRDGKAAADPILIDTTKNVITGRGGFNFRDERMDMAFRAYGKKFSLFSGQSPIGLGGYFAAPMINPLSNALFERAGVGVGLGLLMPPAALLAFVDPGTAKSAACGPVLEGARAVAQRTVGGKPRTDVGNGSAATVEPRKRKKIFGIF